MKTQRHERICAPVRELEVAVVAEAQRQKEECEYRQQKRNGLRCSAFTLEGMGTTDEIRTRGSLE